MSAPGFLWHGILDVIERLKYGDECRPSPALEEPEFTPNWPVRDEPIAPARRLDTVGAWTGSATLRDPESNVRAAAQMGIHELHVMVADHSALREPTNFFATPRKGRQVAKIATLEKVARSCADYGVRLCLTTWVMPHPEYIDGLGAYLNAVVRALEPISPVREIVLDAEEPWTQATRRDLTYAGSAARLARQTEALRDFGVRFGLTGIGYARESRLDPLASWCDVAIPQVYATTNNKLDPRTSPMKFARHWTTMFERYELVIGLPAYRQAKGMMAEALAGAREVASDFTTAECHRVIYWSLAYLRASAEKAKLVSTIGGGS